MDIELAYNQALDYIYSFIDYSREKTAKLAKAEFKLERMFALLEVLGTPQDAYPSLHVGGTKGKGSTSALMASALSAAGVKTGLYTSPHLQDFAERIQVDGQPIPHIELARLVEEMKPAIARVPELTTFEITTALGFLYFARQGVGAAVIEVGLGGRLDATNVITPRVAVITSLSYDHMAVLGSTLTLIAGEKAGIIKPGVPVVSSPQVREALVVLEKVSGERRAPLTLVGRDLSVETREHSLDGQDLAIVDLRSPAAEQKSVILRIPLLGSHQVENAATAFAALQASRLEIPETAVRAGFAGVNWPCRFEIARREPPVIFDSAHNQDSFLRLSRTLDEYFPRMPVLLIMGASEDKNLPGMLHEIQPRVRLLIATRADHPRALDPQHIAAEAESAGIHAEAVASVPAALDRALDLSALGGELVLSAGSMFATAEVKTAWQNNVGIHSR
jgi:dihydrofolate synthase/folylpolyglutamate synthase